MIPLGLESWTVRLVKVEIVFWDCFSSLRSAASFVQGRFYISCGWNKPVKPNRKCSGRTLRSMKWGFLFVKPLSVHYSRSDFWFPTYISCFKSRFIQVDVAFSEGERLTVWQQTILQRKKKKICVQGENASVMVKKDVLYKECVYTVISEVRAGFHFQMTGYCRLGGKKSSVGSFASKEAIVGTVVNLLGRTCSTEHEFNKWLWMKLKQLQRQCY